MLPKTVTASPAQSLSLIPAASAPAGPSCIDLAPGFTLATSLSLSMSTSTSLNTLVVSGHWLSALPVELILNIFSYLCPEDLCNVSCACSVAYTLANDDRVRLSETNPRCLTVYSYGKNSCAQLSGSSITSE
jgi:hypothetical protein